MVNKTVFFRFILVAFQIINLFSSNSVLSKNALVTIPKCGSFLLLKTIQLINGKKERIMPKELYLIPDSTMKTFFDKDVILSSHAIYVDMNINQLNKNNIKTIFIYRDPRDQIVSAAFWIKKNSHWPHANWDINSLIDELIICGGSIWGTIFKLATQIPDADLPWLGLKGIAEFYNMYLPWRFEPNVYTTTFEKLVGPRGGGNLESQLNEIMAITQHMGMNLDRRQATRIAHSLFGGTLTFREGKIGSYKKHFLERHKIAFKTKHNGAGQKLLEYLGYEKDANW